MPLTLNPDTTFLAFDFEATGLDTKKDEPIQIGIVRADSQFKILDTYTSLIKPKKDIKELKGIVKRITGLSLDQLSDAPSMEDILPEIQDWFTDDVVVVGHNIAFDIAMMKPFLPEWEPQKQYDTFDRSQILIHYPPSYALEVLWEQITEDYARDPFVLPDGQTRDYTDESHHDALYDSFTSLALARHQLRRIQTLCESYDRLPQIVGQHSLLGSLVECGTETVSEISLPILTKPVPKNTRDTNLQTPKVDLHSLENNKTRFSGHVSLEEMLLSAVASKPIIITTHTGQKLEIIKQILARHGHHDIGFAKPEQHLDYEAFTSLLSHEELSDDIVTFGLKYASHHHQGLRVLQLLTENERAIFGVLETTADRHTKDIILCSHGGLYRLIQQGLYPEYQILFLDADRWYHSYNRFRSVSFDPYQALTNLERIHRCYEIRELIEHDDHHEQLIDQLQAAISECTMFVGMIGIETTEQFTGRPADTLETGPLVDKLERHRTTSARPRLRAALDILIAHEDIIDNRIILQLRDHIEHIMTEVITIRRSIRDRGYLHYTYSTTHEYSDFSEFMDVFAGRKAVITSHARSANKPIIPITSGYTPPAYPYAPTPPQLQREIQTLDPQGAMTFFVLSSSKSSSQSLFQKLQSDPALSGYSLIVDGITGSTAKNTHKAKAAGPTIIIGGYYFYLNLIAKKVPIDHIIIYALGGSMKPLILGDVGYYS